MSESVLYLLLGGLNQDVPPYLMVDGNPVRARTLNKVGLERHNISHAVQLQLKHAYRLIFRSGMAIDNAVNQLEEEGTLLPETEHLINFVRNSPRGVCK